MSSKSTDQPQPPPLNVEKIRRLYRLLETSYAFDDSWPGGQWPLRGGFRPAWLEVALGAVLTQNTRWENVEAALEGLREARLVDLPSLATSPEGELQQAIRPAGFFRRKSATLLSLAAFLQNHDGGPTEREALIGISGIGPETADSILLYAWGRPHFVVDAYTCRLLVRLGLCPPHPPYDLVQHQFEAALRGDVKAYQKCHALIVQHGKQRCRRRPFCDGCPFSESCPRNGVPLR